MDKVQGTFLIANELGLHARAATLVAKVASKYKASVILKNGEQEARASSVIELLQLCGQSGAKIVVTAEGVDADRAVKAIGELFKDSFGEEQ